MGVKVKLRDLPRGASPDAHDRAFRGMMAASKRAVNESGILQDLSKRKYYESKGQKKRRKREENAVLRMKESVVLTCRQERRANSEWRDYE